jgi:ComF family protein
MRSRLSHLPNEILNVVFPPVCAGCNKVGELFCGECASQVQWVKEPICTSCGKPSATVLGLCGNCTRHPLAVNQIRAAALHEDPVRRTLHQMKYEGFFSLANPLGEIMVEAWSRWQLPYDMVVPIPLHAERKRQRGYNQAELLVQAVKKILSWNSAPEVLRRHKRTAPQVGLTIDQRRHNVRGAFSANKDKIAGQRILLVDDVCTTGSTLDSAARVLLDAGALSVDAFCLTTVSNRYDTFHV